MAMAMINARFLIRIPQDTSGKSEKPKEPSADQSNNNIMAPRDNIPLESSDTSESEEDKNQVSRTGLGPVVCPVKHEGRLVLSEELSIPVDELFKLMFTEHPAMGRVIATMKYTDVTVTPWEEDSETGLKKRVVRLIVPITQPIGPKSSNLTDTQTLRCCRPGELYVVDKECVNGGVPYCDSFYTLVHFCVTRVSDTQSSITSYAQIIYRKSVWGLIKSFIEKNVWAGFEDYMSVVRKELREECRRIHAENGVEVVEEKLRAVEVPVETAPLLAPTVSPVVGGGINETALWVVLGVLLALLLLNTVMYYKLLASQPVSKPTSLPPIFHPDMFSEERSKAQWVSLVQQQAAHHQAEVQRWRTALQSAVSLLKQAEEKISDLQLDVRSSIQDSMAAALKPLSSLNNDGTSRDEL